MPLRIVVLIKQVPDANGLRIDKASGKPVFSGQLAISSYDDYAIEEALRLKERYEGEVIAVAAGPASVKDAVSRALAMGADRGVIVGIDKPNELETLALARALAEVVRGLAPDIVLAGQNSDDYATGQVGPQVAELLGMPSLGSIAGITAEGPTLTVVRDTEDGRQTVRVQAPVVLMAQAGLNEPRYPSLKGIMAAKKKPLETVPAAITAGTGRVSWSDPVAPPKTATGVVLADLPAADAAKQLVSWLREQKLV